MPILNLSFQCKNLAGHGIILQYFYRSKYGAIIHEAHHLLRLIIHETLPLLRSIVHETHHPPRSIELFKRCQKRRIFHLLSDLVLESYVKFHSNETCFSPAPKVTFSLCATNLRSYFPSQSASGGFLLWYVFCSSMID